MAPNVVLVPWPYDRIASHTKPTAAAQEPARGWDAADWAAGQQGIAQDSAQLSLTTRLPREALAAGAL